jgi:ubiquinone/menaquinone biosynthesis C-methylase UbiE
LKSSIDQDAWRGPEPLPNPLDVARLGEIYSRTAAFYDGIVAERQAGPKLEALRQLDRGPDERFLEIGVGTAWAFSRLVSDSGIQGAYGLDVAAGMLDVARERLSVRAEPVEAREAPSAPLLLADARYLPFADATLDCLLNTYTFEVLATPDIRSVISECLRVLKPGGRIGVANLTDGEGADAAMTEDWKRRYADDPEYFGGARPLHLQPMLEACGFTSVTRTYVGPDWPSEVLLAYHPRSASGASPA